MSDTTTRRYWIPVGSGIRYPPEVFVHINGNVFTDTTTHYHADITATVDGHERVNDWLALVALAQ